jgi:pSer/pThr/pTyr-binding forkhead associated (FHA) protein
MHRLKRVRLAMVFKDSGSLNGSYVNNESVTEKRLVAGDEIQIGKFHLLFSAVNL